MKHLKEYKSNPKIGDYVICQEDNNFRSDLNNFLLNNIGEIVSIDTLYSSDGKGYNLYVTKYDTVIPIKLKNLFIFDEFSDRRGFYPDEIIHKSENKKDLNIIIDANKYNL